MARIYVASSWRNAQQPAVVEALRAANHLVYHLLLTHPVVSHGFLSDLRGMQWADTCVLVLPCGRSAHLEAGWFAGQGRRIIILTRDGEEPEFMALLATDICVSLDEVLAVLGESTSVNTRSRVEPGELDALREC